jgi:carbonic anhydrase
LFVVRLAGNVISPTAVGSLEFATAVLGSQLIVVLGHERCGAVSAAVKGDPLPGRIGTFVEDIKPAVARVKNKSGDPVDNAVVANVQYQVELLQETSIMLAQMIAEGKLKVVGGRYDLDTGEVRIVT